MLGDSRSASHRPPIAGFELTTEALIQGKSLSQTLIDALTGKVGSDTKNCGNPTSMIGLCQEGKSSPGALRRIAGTKLFLILRRVYWPLSRGSFLIEESDFHDRSSSRGQKLSRRASEERGYKSF
jgi:hypothetical protein